MFAISVSTSFTGALSRHYFACLILSNFFSIDLIPGHRSLNSCFKKAEIIMRAIKFYIKDMGSLKLINAPRLFSSLFLPPGRYEKIKQC